MEKLTIAQRIRLLQTRVLKARDALDCCSRGKSNSSWGIQRLMDLISEEFQKRGQGITSTATMLVEPLPIAVRVAAPIRWPIVFELWGATEEIGGIVLEDQFEEVEIPDTEAKLQAMAEFARVAAATIRKKAVDDCLNCVEKKLLRQDRPRVYETGTFRIRQNR